MEAYRRLQSTVTTAAKYLAPSLATLILAACAAETITRFTYSLGNGQQCVLKYVEIDKGAGSHASCEIEMSGIASILVTASTERVGEFQVSVSPKPGIETRWSSEYVTFVYLPYGEKEEVRVLSFAPARGLTDEQRARSSTRGSDGSESQSVSLMRIRFRSDSLELRLPDLETPNGNLTVPTVRVDRSRQVRVLPLPFVRVDRSREVIGCLGDLSRRHRRAETERRLVQFELASHLCVA
jgi:hypothetical protein